jgi:hypothetical protein
MPALIAEAARIEARSARVPAIHLFPAPSPVPANANDTITANHVKLEPRLDQVCCISGGDRTSLPALPAARGNCTLPSMPSIFRWLSPAKLPSLFLQSKG